MFFHCPNCLTCFQLEPIEIGAHGRKVRCSRCGSVWFQKQSVGSLQPAEPDGKKEFKPINTAAKSINSPYNKGTAGLVSWLLVCGIFSVILIAIYIERESVLSNFPKSSGIYRLFGMLPKPGGGLSFQDHKIKAVSGNGSVHVKIEGEIVNSSRATKIVPKLLGIIQNENGKELQRWVFNSPLSKLLNGERVKFTTFVLNPPSGNLVFVITFDGIKTVNNK